MMKTAFSRRFAALVILSAAFICWMAVQSPAKDEHKRVAHGSKAHSTILFIGDGMGPTHIVAARIKQTGGVRPLAMESMPVLGMARTWSSDQLLTDSAAAGTALSTGIKTYNGAICMSDPKVDPTGASRPLETVVAAAQAAGKATGVLTTCRVTHATPACFYAHSGGRNEEDAIAAQALDSGLDLLMGGGRMFFHPAAWVDPETSATGHRADGRDLEKELAASGWKPVESLAQLNALNPAAKGLKVLGLFDYDHMQYEKDRADDKLGEPSLAEMTEFAIKLLSRDPDGYFLMVEAGRIDHASHDRNPEAAVPDVLALDEAVTAARRLVDKNTLILVTADHETGGLCIHGSAPISWDKASGAVSAAAGPQFVYSTGDHTPVDVTVMAEGPGAEAFTGRMENVDIIERVARAMKLKFKSAANQENMAVERKALRASHAEAAGKH